MSIAPKLDIIDATVLDWALAYIFSNNAERILLNGETYHWLSYSACMTDLPLLHVSSKDSIRRRFKNLVESKLLEAYPNNQTQGRTYFKAGILASALYFEPSDSLANLLPPLQKCHTPYGKNAIPPMAKMHNDYYTIDTNIKDNLSLSLRSRDFDFSSNPAQLTKPNEKQ